MVWMSRFFVSKATAVSCLGHLWALFAFRAVLVWSYKRCAIEQRRGDQMAYAAAEVGARRAKIMLWNEPEPIPPGNFER